MTNPALMVFTSPVEGQDAEYNDWYSNVHLSEVLEVPGIIAAQRWQVGEASTDSPTHRYLAIYELDERPAADVIASLVATASTMNISQALGDSLMVLYEPLTARITRVGGRAT
jgi:hypothetical protein